jgi:hypothetical protein
VSVKQFLWPTKLSSASVDLLTYFLPLSSLLDNNERLRSLSSEIQHLETLSEFQVDENELSNAAKGSSRNKRSITWYVTMINLMILSCG